MNRTAVIIAILANLGLIAIPVALFTGVSDSYGYGLVLWLVLLIISFCAAEIAGNETAAHREPESEVTVPSSLKDPAPSDVIYDDMTRAWRNADYPLAWHLADVILQYTANGGEPLTGDRLLYYVRAIHAHYAPSS